MGQGLCHCYEYGGPTTCFIIIGVYIVDEANGHILDPFLNIGRDVLHNNLYWWHSCMSAN
jgi:hypothetical protein